MLVVEAALAERAIFVAVQIDSLEHVIVVDHEGAGALETHGLGRRGGGRGGGTVCCVHVGEFVWLGGLCLGTGDRPCHEAWLAEVLG